MGRALSTTAAGRRPDARTPLAVLGPATDPGPKALFAGGGPENVVLVVNSQSWASRTIANHYRQQRGIPDNNVIHIAYTGSRENLDVESFRTQLLGPVLQEIQRRGLGGQTDYLVWSADFPFRIDLQPDLDQLGPQVAPQFAMLVKKFPYASLTGLTYLWSATLQRNPLAYTRLDANHYFQRADDGVPASHAFRSWYGWGPAGELLEAGGSHYLLSVMLGVTAGRGNSVREVLDYLQRSRAADGTFPEGTVYFLRNNDIRSKARHEAFPAAAAALKELGIAAEVTEGTLPSDAPHVQGLMVGAAAFDWQKSGSRIAPGAICEHFTSLGGVLFEDAGQTPLVEFLRHGAAAASGTVTEPYAVPQKFPHPAMHVHYARGCSLAEAFYQSVAGPYQLLIVGDPLCQPWADRPQVELPDLKPPVVLRGGGTWSPSARFEKEGRVGRWSLCIDGRQMVTAADGQPLVFDSRHLPDGYHELSFVAVAEGPTETQGRRLVPALVQNHGHRCELVAEPAEAVDWSESLLLRASAPAARAIGIYQQQRLLGTIEGSSGGLVIPAVELGFGPTALRAVAVGPQPGATMAVSPPVHVEVRPQPAWPALDMQPPPSRGVRLRSAGVSGTVGNTFPRDWLAQAGVAPEKTFALDGYFQVPEEDVYQFSLSHDGPVELRVDGHVLYDVRRGEPQHTIQLPVVLAAGWHRLELVGTATAQRVLDVRFGGPGLRRIGSGDFWCHP